MICEELPGDFAPRPLERGFELGERLDRAVRPHAVVVVVGPAVAAEHGLELVLEPTLLLRVGEPLLALGGVLIGVAPRDVEDVGEHFRGLAHVELDDGVGQAALEPDDRLEERGTESRERGEARADVARGEQVREPVDSALAEEERRPAQRIGAAGEDEIGLAFADVLVRGVDRQHAGAAVDLHRERGHRLAHAEAQRRDARGVRFVREHDDAAEDDLVECIRRERLAQQQRLAAGDGEIDRRERPRPPARADERRAAAVDDVDRASRYAAAVTRSSIGDGNSPLRANSCA